MSIDKFNKQRLFAKPDDQGGKPEMANAPKHLFQLLEADINRLQEQVRPIAQFMADEIDGRAYILFDMLMPDILNNIDEFENTTAEVREWIDALNDLINGEYDLAIGVLNKELAESEDTEDFSHLITDGGPNKNDQFSEKEISESDKIASFIATLRALASE